METDREELLEVLNLVRPAVSSSSQEIIEQSNHFIFSKNEILAYNDRLLIAYEYDTDLKCTVEASLLFKLLSRMKSETVNLDRDGGKLNIWDDKVNASIPIVEESEIFDYIQKVTENLKDVEWYELSEDFTEGLRLCAFSAETDQMQGTLTCVRVEGKDVMSGSRSRVSWYEMDKPVPEDFYIQANLIQELARYEGISSYALSKSWAHFKSDAGITFSARRVIPMDLLPFREPFKDLTDGVRLRVPADLRESIETVNIVNEGEMAGDKLVTLIIDSDRITCESVTKRGKISEDVLFDKPNDLEELIKVRIRPEFLIDVLDKTTFMYIKQPMILFKRQAFKHLAMMDID